MGFGQTTTGGAVSTALRWVNKQTITNPACVYVYGTTVVIPSVLCAKGLDNPSDNVCGGDAGGPLILTNLGINRLIGVISFVSNEGCTSGWPSGYTRVGYFLNWISTHTGIAISP